MLSNHDPDSSLDYYWTNGCVCVWRGVGEGGAAASLSVWIMWNAQKPKHAQYMNHYQCIVIHKHMLHVIFMFQCMLTYGMHTRRCGSCGLGHMVWMYISLGVCGRSQCTIAIVPFLLNVGITYVVHLSKTGFLDKSWPCRWSKLEPSFEADETCFYMFMCDVVTDQYAWVFFSLR